jgi:hypothetical protein
MSVRVFYDILNQKGTPAMYTDTFANRPAYGYQGRLFISTDSGQIFEDTGSAWTLVADAGVGGGTLSSVCLNGNTTATGIVITAGGLSSNSITNTGNTAGSVLFAGASGLESQSNATFFWDNTNKRLGIGNASPGAPLDIHGTGTQLQLNGTGSSNSYIQFQNAGVSKWRIGNTYSAGANSYGIYNNNLSSLALTINSTNNGIITTGYLNIENALGSNQIYLAKLSSDTYGTIQTEAGGGKYSLGNVSNLGTLGTAVITWTSGLQVGINNISPTYDFDVTGTGRFTGILRLGSTLSNGTYFYTLPSATGTLALTSNLSSYLPLTGGTLTGQLYINPTNTATTGLDVASDNISFRSDNLEGSKRQLLITMGSGTLIQFTAQGYGANYGTDLAFYTATTGGVNSSPAIYITGTNNRVGIKTGSPAYDLDVSGTGRFTSTLLVSGAATFNSNVTATQVFVNGAAGNNYIAFNQSSVTNIGYVGDANWCFGGSTSDFGIRATNNIVFGIGASEKMRITSGGNVGINITPTAGWQFNVKGIDSGSSNLCLYTTNTNGDNLLYVRNDGLILTGNAANSPYNYSTSGRSAIIQSNGILGYLVSTRESKTNIESIKNVDFINLLNPVQFNYRKKDNINNVYTDEIYENTTYGFIADEVEKVNKELVFYNEDGTLAGVEYNNMISILTKAIQELNEKLVRNNIN